MSSEITVGIPYTVETGEKLVNETFGPTTLAGASQASMS